MEVFEVRERISDTDSAADLQRLLNNVQEDIAQIERAFATSLESANEARAVQYAVRLKYYHKVSSLQPYCIRILCPPHH